MRALVVYESMFGNTHAIADAIGSGLRVAYDVQVVPVGSATADVLADVDLLVVGGPTHVHGMSRPATRKAALEQAGTTTPDAAATGPGVREWIDSFDALPFHAAAFDTRIKAPAILTGRASSAIGKQLRRHGASEVLSSESFFVTKDNQLQDGEEERARQWGTQLASWR